MMIRWLRFLLATTPVLAFFSILIALFATNTFVGSGRQFVELDRAIEAVGEENVMLEQKVASVSALGAIEVRARELGFTRVPSYVSIGSEQVALHELR